MARAPVTRQAAPTLDLSVLPDRAGNLELPRGGAGVAAASFSAVVNQVLERRQDRADRAAVEEASAAGAEAGNAAPGTEMEGGGALYRDAYNRAAMDAGSRRLEISARDELDRLAREHEADPDAFSRAASALRDGMAGSMPQGMRARFSAGWDILARPAFNQILAAQRQRTGEQAIASYNEVLPRRFASIDRLGRASIRDPAAAQALRMEESSALEDLVRLGPRSAFTFAGREYAADPTRSGALTLPEMVRQRQQIEERGLVATAMGAFEAGPRTESWVNEWSRRELSREGSGLTPELVRRIEREMRSEVARLSALRTEGQGRAWAGLQDRLTANAASVQLTGRETDRITDQQFLAAGRSPEWIAQYRRRVEFGQHAFAVRQEISQATPDQLEQIRARLLPGGDLFRLNPEGAVGLAGTLDQRRQGVARSTFNDAVADARAQAAAGDGTPAPRLTPEQAAQAGVPPEQLEATNRGIGVTEDQARLRQLGATGTPEEIEAARRSMPITGPEAAENALRFQALQQGVQARLQAAERPGDYVQQNFPVVRESWQQALEDPGRTATAIAATLDAQERLGIPTAQRVPVPTAIAQQLVQRVASVASDPERLQLLQRLTAGIPDAAARAQVLTAMRGAGLGQNLYVAAALQPRTGEVIAGRVATELATDVQRLPLQETERRAIRDTVDGIWEDDDRLGGLRAAQYQATGSAAFLTLGEQERGLLRHLGQVRGAPSASLGTAEARRAYDQLYGGRVIINEESRGVVVHAPEGTDPRRLIAGLTRLASDTITARLGTDPQTASQREALRQQAIWANDGAGGFALYARGSGAYINGADGRPLVVSREQALAAADLPAAGMPPARQASPEEIERRRLQRDPTRPTAPRMPFSRAVRPDE